MPLTFTHTFEDCSADGTLSIDSDAEPPAQVRAEVDEEGHVWLIANPAGWLHLARVCAELGMSQYEDGYHFHKDSHFDHISGPPEIAFMVERADDA